MKHKLFVLALLLSLITYSEAQAFNASTKWTAQLDSALTSGIAISGNTLLLGTETGMFYAIDKASGSTLWDFKGTGIICGTPSIVNGSVIFAQSDGTITCLNVSEGSTLWLSRPYDDSSDSLSDGTASGGGMIFVSRSDGRLCALDDSNGHVLWTYEAQGRVLRTAPEYSEGFVLLGEYDGRLSIIDSQTGERLNGGGAGGAVNTPSINEGNVYYSAWDGSVKCFRLRDVVPVWSIKLQDPVTTSPVIESGIVLVGTARGSIAALDESDGRELWRFETNGGSVQAKPAVIDGLVFAGAEQGKLFVLDAKSGRLVNTFKTESGIDTNPAVSEEVFYFGNDRGEIYALQ